MPPLSGFAKDWLASRRDELNGRFKVAQRRFPSLDGAAVLGLSAELLPALAGEGGEGAADLLSSGYDLILLHCGRGTLAPGGGGSRPGVAALFRDVFPRVRPLLLQRPRRLPGALSNAVENMGERGVEFARILGEAADGLTHGEDLERLGAVVAWRLGEARLRTEALRAAEELPANPVLRALRLGTWPEESAAVVVAALAADAWRAPEAALEEDAVKRLAGAPRGEIERIRRAVSAAPRAPLGAWGPAGRAGEFSGFGGPFDEPPLLLNAGAEGNRHRFFAMAGDAAWRIDADLYGWACRADNAAANYSVREAKARGRIASLLFRGDDGSPALAPDGTVTFGGESAKFPAAAGATSFVSSADVLAYTLPDSHRIRILAPKSEAL
ncbi:MAG: hypothetical protein HYY18_03000 [Planctomycetes bacterium]|nr:hypothetical protein [Planctomycetota bacterium]